MIGFIIFDSILCLVFLFTFIQLKKKDAEIKALKKERDNLFDDLDDINAF